MSELITPADIEVMAIRAGKRMTVVCREAGVAHSTFSNWKHGKSATTTATIKKLLAALNAKGGTLE